MHTAAAVTSPKRSTAITLHRLAYKICRYWLPLFLLLYGIYVGLPFLAPVFMATGLSGPGQAIYTLYSFLCHQLPERSFFLFGPRIMVPLADIFAHWTPTSNPLILRQFIGSPALGWKVAWSDRMVSMFTSIWVFAWAWWLLRHKIRPVSWQVFVLLLLPMALDGSSHFISDLSGLHQGFRDSNAWLAAITQNAFGPGIYAGDAWGSFNSLMRLLSGTLFGLGITWFGFPYLDAYFNDQVTWIKYKFEKAGLSL